MRTYLFILVAFFFFFVKLSAQRRVSDDQMKPGEIEKYAEIYLQEGKFEKAVLLYRRLLEDNPESPKLCFLVGYCYLNTEYSLDLAITQLKKSVDVKPVSNEDKAPQESSYYLALAYYKNNQLNEAIEILNNLLPLISDKDQLFKSQIFNLLERCHDATMLSQSSVSIDIDNLFELNSKYADKYPLILNDGKEIIFTSTREIEGLRGGNKNKNDNDNIYYARKDGDTWSTPFGIGPSVNTVENETACWVSKEGDFLIIRRIDKNKSNIYYCKRKNNSEWSTPVKFPSPINSKFNETFGSLSPDGKFLYFTSDRKEGYGGTDIYVSEKIGEDFWGHPVNLGRAINTSLNEESPFLHENGVLFFCSQGHISMGGFDVFASYRDENGVWQQVANMGIPINSFNDDFFYQPGQDGKFAYASSVRSGTKGQSDIVRYQISDSLKNGFATIVGLIDCSAQVELEKETEIQIEESGNSKNTRKYNPNQYGEFSFTIPAGKDYLMTYSYKHKPFHKVLLKIPVSYSFLAHDQSVRVKTVELRFDNNFNPDVGKDFENLVESYSSKEKVTETIKSAALLVKKEETNTDSLIVSNLNTTDSKSFLDSNITVTKYCVKIVSSYKKLPVSSFNGIEDVKEFHSDNGAYIYYVGEYDYEWEAEIKLRLIRNSYPKASVIINRFTEPVTN